MEEDKTKVKVPLFVRILVPVVIIIIGAVATSTYIAFVQESRFFGETLVAKGKRLAETIGTSTVNSFASLNWIYTEKLLKESKSSDEDVVFVKIVNSLSEVYLASEEEYYGQAVPAEHVLQTPQIIKDFSFKKENNIGYLISHPFMIGPEIWHVLVGISNQTINDTKREHLYRSYITGLIIILVGTILSFLISRSISKPVSELSNAAIQVAQGQFEPIHINTEDEIGLLCENFNTMTKHLKISQQALEESEKKFRSISSSAQDAIIMIDNNGRVSYWNEAAHKIFGYSFEEIMGKELHRLIVPDRFYPDFQKAFGNFRESGEGSVVGKTTELVGLKKNSTEIPIELSISAVKISGQWNAIGIARDISERKKNEVELEKHREQLETLVKERTKELEKAQAELVNRAVEAGRAQLSAMILHNIGNAITPVMVGLENAIKDDSRHINEYLAKCYNDLKSKKDQLGTYVTVDAKGKKIASYMGELIGSLEDIRKNQSMILMDMNAGLEYVSEILTLQQAYSADKNEVKQKSNFNALVQDAVKMQRPAIEKRDIILQLDLEPLMPELIIEKSKLMQVIVNLIKNSCDAIDEYENFNQTHKKWIAIKTYTKDAYAVLKISDSGIGIENEELADVFKFGVSSKGSSGFGLYYCRSFIESNNGTIAIESQGPKMGSTTTIKFDLNI